MKVIDVIGIGEADVPPAARTLIEQADVLVGGERHLALVPFGPAQRHLWPTPFSDARALLESLSDKKVVVLASGEPLWFGAGATLIRWFGTDRVRVHPHPGAFSLAAARLGWALHDAQCLSAHGRPVEALVPHFAPAAKLLVLAADGQTAGHLAQLLTKNGYNTSKVTVLSHLGSPQEDRTQGIAENWTGETPGLSVLAVECRAAPDARLLGLAPGLPDDAFEHDGQLTKRVVRAATISALAPLKGQMLWDIGAGSGSVAIEAMRLGVQAVAVESSPERVARIARNALHLGVPGLTILTGKAPDLLPDGTPDLIFVGGGSSDAGLLQILWDRLRPGGRLVVNAVTLEAEAQVIARFQSHGGTLIRIGVDHLTAIGPYHAWESARPVIQYAAVKS